MFKKLIDCIRSLHIGQPIKIGEFRLIPLVNNTLKRFPMTNRDIDLSYSPYVSILEHATKKSQRSYGLAYGSDNIVLKYEHMVALEEGKMLALPINHGEYVAFIVKEL